MAVREITQMIGELSYSAVAVLPAPLHCRSLQRQQILKLSMQKIYQEDKKDITKEIKTSNNVASDASMKGWGA